MALPVISSITFDKTSYNAGDTITATVHYQDMNTHGTSYTLVGTVTDQSTAEVGTMAATFIVGGSANAAAASISGGETGQVWTKVSDDGKSVAVFTSKAV